MRELLDFPWYTYLILAVGAFVFLGGVIGGIAKALWLLRVEKAVGVVVGNTMHATKANAKPRYYPIIKFTTAEGQDHTLTSQVGWGRKPPYENGTEVPVLYDPRAPEKAEIDDFLNKWMLHLGLLMGGVMLIVMATVYAFV